MSASDAMPTTIRVATPADAASLVTIYRPYVERTAVYPFPKLQRG